MFNEWKAEMEMMSGRIKGVRQSLYDELNVLMPEKVRGYFSQCVSLFDGYVFHKYHLSVRST